MKAKLFFVLALMIIVTLGPACADVNFGSYARSIAMGGAGIALVDDPIEAGAINPAAYAVKSPGFKLVMPSLDFRTEGVSLSDFVDVSSNVQDASDDNAVELARELGKQNSKVELNFSTGITAGPMVITADGQAAVEIRPSDRFKEWATNSDAVDWSGYIDPDTGEANLTALQNDYYADVTGHAVVSLPAIGMGFKVPGKKGLNVGVRVKMLQSTAVVERVRPSAATVNGSTIDLQLDTVDDSGTIEEIDDSGLGADFGIIYQTPNPKVMQMTTALVMTNLLKPNLKGIDLQRMFSAGAAVRVSNKTLFVADIVNITGAYNQNMKLRLGAEITPLKWLALRAGYGSGNFTAGIGVRGMNFAFSKNTPLVVGRAWNF